MNASFSFHLSDPDLSTESKKLGKKSEVKFNSALDMAHMAKQKAQQNHCVCTVLHDMAYVLISASSVQNVAGSQTSFAV